MQKRIIKKLNLYQALVIASMVFALLGFSYNVWRMEVTEQNNTIRTASFQMLLALSELEQVVYLNHYDNDQVNGNPRLGWVKVGLVSDLSILTNATIEQRAFELKQVWSSQWQSLSESEQATQQTINAIDDLRQSIKQEVANLD